MIIRSFSMQNMLTKRKECETMIAAICANPCVDKTITIDKLNIGGMNRIADIRQDGSGKGVNVALACVQLAMESVCIGFMPGEGNALILDRLKDGGCCADFVACAGAVRINTKVLDQSNGVVTELNESGPTVPKDKVDSLIKTAVRWAGKCSYIVLTGSTPPGCPKDIYRTIIEEVKRAAPQCRIVLDAEGERFSEGLRAKPFMVKPNRFELEVLCGRSLPTVEDIHAEALKLIDGGVGLVAVSMGGDGAYITDGKQAFFAPAMKVTVRSTVGAGDSMVAGLLYALEAGKPLEEVFRSGMAAAASSVTTVGTGLIDPELFREYIDKIDVGQVG
jgi:1-phosphofructokinase